jgi:hypothetical protein
MYNLVRQLEGSRHSQELEHGSRGITIVEAVTGKQLVNILQAGKYLARAVVICKVWKPVIVL